jgi:GNAT superfamily N-acetyltransferase
MRNGEPLFGPLAEPPCGERLEAMAHMARKVVLQAMARGSCFLLRESADKQRVVAATCCAPPKNGSSLPGTTPNASPLRVVDPARPVTGWPQGKHPGRVWLRPGPKERGPLISTDFAAAHSRVVDPARHWYVEILATAPEFQGQSKGKQLLSWVLNVAARDGVDTYLETTGARNRRFYEMQGFTAVETQKFRSISDPSYPVLQFFYMSTKDGSASSGSKL